MNQKYRKLYNAQFSSEKYTNLIEAISNDFDYKPTFRIAESPFFISKDLKSQLLEGCQQVIDFIKKEDFKQITNKALELNRKVPNEDEHTTFLAIDFGICEENGKIIPKLIEVQGFPSLFNFQPNLFNKFKNEAPRKLASNACLGDVCLSIGDPISISSPFKAASLVLCVPPQSEMTTPSKFQSVLRTLFKRSS